MAIWVALHNYQTGPAAIATFPLQQLSSISKDYSFFLFPFSLSFLWSVFFPSSPFHFAVLCLKLDKVFQLAFTNAEPNGMTLYTMSPTLFLLLFLNTSSYCDCCSIYFSCCGLILLIPGKHMILRVATPFLKNCSSSSLFFTMDLCSWLCLLKCCALQFSLLNYMLFLRSLPIFAHVTLHSSPVLQCAYNPFLPTVTCKCSIYML